MRHLARTKVSTSAVKAITTTMTIARVFSNTKFSSPAFGTYAITLVVTFVMELFISLVRIEFDFKVLFY
jgi:hypothetical protein